MTCWIIFTSSEVGEQYQALVNVAPEDLQILVRFFCVDSNEKELLNPLLVLSSEVLSAGVELPSDIWALQCLWSNQECQGFAIPDVPASSRAEEATSLTCFLLHPKQEIRMKAD